MRRPASAALAVALLLAGCAGGGGTGSPEAACPDGSAPVATAPAGSDVLPVRSLSWLGEEGEVSTACWLGEPLVVNFWAEWCEPCKEEMPALEATHQALGEQVRFVGVDYEDRAEAALRFAEEVGVTYELVEDPDGAFFDAVRGRGTPMTMLVTADGEIVYRHAGPLSQDQLTDLVATHLDVSV